MNSEYLIGAGLLLVILACGTVMLVRVLLVRWKDQIAASSYASGHNDGFRHGWKRGKEDAEAKARADAEAEKQRRVSSCMASDLPTAQPFEVVYASTECVSLQAEVILSDREMEQATKGQVIAELARQIYANAIQYIDVQQVEDPMLCGTRIRGVLRIVKVNR